MPSDSIDLTMKFIFIEFARMSLGNLEESLHTMWANEVEFESHCIKVDRNRSRRQV